MLCLICVVRVIICWVSCWLFSVWFLINLVVLISWISRLWCCVVRMRIWWIGWWCLSGSRRSIIRILICGLRSLSCSRWWLMVLKVLCSWVKWMCLVWCSSSFVMVILRWLWFCFVCLLWSICRVFISWLCSIGMVMCNMCCVIIVVWWWCGKGLLVSFCNICVWLMFLWWLVWISLSKVRRWLWRRCLSRLCCSMLVWMWCRWCRVSWKWLNNYCDGLLIVL